MSAIGVDSPTDGHGSVLMREYARSSLPRLKRGKFRDEIARDASC
jgi:hypothetical protein